MSDAVGRYVLVRSPDDGVKFGRLTSLVTSPMGLGVATLDEAQVIHSWSDGKTMTLIEMANEGCGNALISQPAKLPVIVFGVCGVLQCTEKAIVNLKKSRNDELPQFSM